MAVAKNVLFVFADQMHAFAMGCMGNGDILTPNLDRLAERGTLFTRCYSSNPVCSPYRGALMSGRYSCQTGMVGINNLPVPPGEKCVAECLNEAGLRTSYVGKWHIGNSGNIAVPEGFRCGFTDFTGSQCVNNFYEEVWFFDEDGVCQEVKKHRTNAAVDVALERLEGMKDEPWALFVSFSNPHYPVEPDPEFEAMYADVELTMRPNFVEGVDPYTCPYTPRWQGDPEKHPYKLSLGGSMDRYIRLYYGMVSQLDAQVGRLLDRLEELGVYDETLIVFTSDHGDMQGSHGKINKHVAYEESTHVPLIVRVPGQEEGLVADVPVDTVDFLPTLVEAAGGVVPDQAEGKSLLELASGSKVPHKPLVWVENGWPQGGYYMIVKGDYKLAVRCDGFVPHHFWDVGKDPYELDDLVAKPEMAGLRDELLAELKAYHEALVSRANPLRYVAGDTARWWKHVEDNPELTEAEKSDPAYIARYLESVR